MSIDDRIEALECLAAELGLCSSSIPGTVLQRTLHSKSGVDWTLGIGTLNERKVFYSGDTIEDVLTIAENALEKLAKERYK